MAEQLSPSGDPSRDLPCLRRHPGWRAGMDYGSNPELRGAWQVVGDAAYGLQVDHDAQHFSDSVVIAPGAVLLYLGSSYWYDCYAETGQHIFQVLDPGPGHRADASLDPRLRGPLRVGECYELTEGIDPTTADRWWPAIFRRVDWPLVSATDER